MHGPSVQQARLGVRVKRNAISIQTHQKSRLLSAKINGLS